MVDAMTDARTARQPNNQDPQELRIQQRIKDDLLSTEHARAMVTRMRELQETFFLDAFSNLEHGDEIYKSYKILVAKLSQTSRSHISDGVENLKNISPPKGAILTVNHLGLIKATKIDNSANRFPTQLSSFEPFPLRHAPFLPVAEQLGIDLIESAIELPPPLLDIQHACGVITVGASGTGRTEKLIEDVKQQISIKPSLIVMYPEGGTSGKRNDGGPYDLDTFHTGAFVVAKNLGIPIIPAYQFFNPNTGFEIGVLTPILPEELAFTDPTFVASNTQKTMQEQLDLKR